MTTLAYAHCSWTHPLATCSGDHFSLPGLVYGLAILTAIFGIPGIVRVVLHRRKEARYREARKRVTGGYAPRITSFEQTMQSHEIWLKHQADMERKAQRDREAGERLFKYLGGGD